MTQPLKQALANPISPEPIAPAQIPAGAIVLVCALGFAGAILPVDWLLGALAVIAACLHPILGLALLVLSVTAQDSIRVLGGLSLTQIAVPLALASISAWALTHPAQQRKLGYNAVAWAVFLIALLLSTALSPYSATEGIKELWRWGAAFLAWLIAACMLQKRWQYVILISALLAAPLLNALIGLSQFVRGDGPAAFRIAADSPFVRAYGTIGQPNSFAGYLNLAWPLAVALAIATSITIWKPRPSDHGDTEFNSSSRSPAVFFILALILWAISAVLIAGLAASFSRGAWLGAGCGILGLILAVGIRNGWRITRRTWVIASLCLVGIGLIIGVLSATQILPSAVTSRVASIVGSIGFFDPRTVAITDQNFAVVERMAQLWAGWQMVLSQPLTGVGPGSYNLAYPALASSPWFASRGHAHNYYLHITAEAGVIGLIAYLALLAIVTHTLLVALRQPQPRFQSAILVGTCGMIAAMAGHNLFENLHVLHLSIQSAATWGMATAIANRSKGI